KLISTAKQNEMYPFIDLARYAQQTLKHNLIQQFIISKTPKMPINFKATALQLKIPKLLNDQNNSTSIKLISKSENDLSVPRSFPTIQELFQQQAKKLPNHLALYTGELELSMTYEQLDKKSNKIARYLSQIGVKVETLVALHLNQDMYMIPWILGILKAGGAYIPIDKTYPAERKNYIIKDSE
ncbi:2979_t:CDS:2, partial [Dentiscutata erythropus]